MATPARFPRTRALACFQLLLGVCVFLSALTSFGSDPAKDAAVVLEESGIKGGIVLQLGIGDGRMLQFLRANESFQVQGLDTDPKKIAAVREAIFAQGTYGLVAVSSFNGKELPYIDNLLNLVVVDDLNSVSLDEVHRVLVPNGVDAACWKC